MNDIRRYGTSRRWADVVVHRGVAHWVEVAEDATADARGQIGQVLAQIDATLVAIGSDRTRLLQVLIYLADAADAAMLNAAWDAWGARRPRSRAGDGAGRARGHVPGGDGRDRRRARCLTPPPAVRAA